MRQALLAATPVAEKKPVTRDVEVAKAAPEAEPAPVLDLTPPKPVSDKRVANDPRERRRLAKQAARASLGTSQASTGSRKELKRKAHLQQSQRLKLWQLPKDLYKQILR